jgi:predicted nucleic acid-binding protein
LIHLDANFLVAALRGDRAAAPRLERWIARDEELAMSAVAWAEMLCGPLTDEEAQHAGFLVRRVEAFQLEDAVLAAELFNRTGRRSRGLADCMIAAAAIRRGCTLATFDRAGFKPFQRFQLRLEAV